MIGNQLTGAQLNAMVGAAAVGMRNACREVLNLQSTIVAQGLSGLQAAPILLDGNDAQAITNVMNYLNNVALVYFGQATVATDFDFDNAVAQVYGGQ